MPKAYMPSLFKYKKKYLKSDILAALVVTAIAVPESLGFAVIAGLPPVMGLYSALLAPIVFGLVASTRRLIVGADSATAALVAGGAVLIAQVGTAEYISAVAILGLLTAIILLLMAALRMGFLADLISRPVLVGFLAGVGVQLMLGKLPEMFGLSTNGSVWQNLSAFTSNLTDINGMALTVSVLVVGIIVFARKSWLPGELIALAAAILFATIFNVSQYNVEMVGALPQGLPPLGLPPIKIGDVVSLLPAALAIALVIIAQSSAVIRSTASEHDDKVRLNQDIFALGLANAASALTRGFAINGSPPRTLAVDMAGGKTQLVNILMAVMIGGLLIYGNNIFTYLPEAALASVVFMIGLSLIRFRELRYIWDTHRAEFFVAAVALLGTATFGVRQGVFIAVIVSLMERLSRQYHPKDEILLRDGEMSQWAKDRIDPENHHKLHPSGLLVYSFNGSLFFENITYFVHRVKRAIDNAKQPVEYVVIDAGAIDNIDYTALEAMKQLYRQLSVDSIKLGFAHVSPNLMQQFEEFGMIDLIGKDNIFSTLNAVIKNPSGSRPPAIEKIKGLGLKPGTYVVIGGAVLEALHLRKTGDIDIVVSDEVYKHFREEKHWKEYTQYNGKKVLSRDGYNLMHSWMGKTLKKLQREAFNIDGVAFMSIDQLMRAKRHLARRKDTTDITLLRDYKRRNK